MVIFLRVLARLDATQAGLMNYLIPFLGVVIAWAVLGERLTLFMILGVMLALVSTLLATVFDAAGVHGENEMKQRRTQREKYLEI